MNSIHAKKIEQRNSAIDLLKIFSMIGVIILHYNNAGIGQAFKYVPLYSMKSYTIFLLQSIFICAVNVFVLISGYFMCRGKEIDLKKPLILLIQVVVFRSLIVIIKAVLGGKRISFLYMLPYLLPTSWFAVLYVCLYCMAPFINKLINTLSVKDLKKLLLICFALFSVWPYCVDVIALFSGKTFNGLSSIGMYGSQSGYTIVQFFLMYLIGAYIRISGKQGSTRNCALSLIGCWLFIFAFSYYLESHDLNRSVAFEYCSPVVIFSAIFLFLFFRNMNIGYLPVISSISRATFSVYLINSCIVADWFPAKAYVQGSGYLMLVHIAVACVVICVLGWVLQIIYDWIVACVERVLRKFLQINTKVAVE